MEVVSRCVDSHQMGFKREAKKRICCVTSLILIAGTGDC
jgi:hypothetical protein